MSCVLPALTYGEDTWIVAYHTQNNLATAQTKMTRRLLNITYQDRKTKIWVGEDTKTTDMIEQIKPQKWSWSEQIRRIPDSRWAARITTGHVMEGNDVEERRRHSGENNETSTGWAASGRGYRKTGRKTDRWIFNDRSALI